MFMFVKRPSYDEKGEVTSQFKETAILISAFNSLCVNTHTHRGLGLGKGHAS